MHHYTFPKGTDLIVAMATAPDPDARFGSNATIAPRRAGRKVRNDPKADLIPMLSP